MSIRRRHKMWTTKEFNTLIQKKLDGVSHTELAKEFGRTKNSVIGTWNNYCRSKVWDWSLIKRVVKEKDHG